METYDFDFSDIINKYSPNEVTVDDIINEIRNVSIDMVSGDNMISAFVDDATTYLYSGAASGNVGAGHLLKIEISKINLTASIKNESFIERGN